MESLDNLKQKIISIGKADSISQFDENSLKETVMGLFPDAVTPDFEWTDQYTEKVADEIKDNPKIYKLFKLKPKRQLELVKKQDYNERFL